MNKMVYGVIVWFIATIFVGYAFCLDTAAAVFSEVIKNSLQASNLEVSIATGAFILGFACMQIPAGYLLDRFNARFVVSAGIFILALGNLTISFSDNLVLFSLSNFLQGLGASFAFIAAAVLISQWFSAKLFPIFFGLTQTLSCVLAGVSHFYFTVALKSYTWQGLYQALALFGFVLFIFACIFLKTPAGYKRGQGLSFIKSLRAVFRNKQLWLCFIGGAASFGVLLSYASFWYTPILTFYAVDKVQAVLVSGIIFMGIGIGTPLLGWVSNVIKSRMVVIHVTLVLGTMALLLGIYLPHFNVDSLLIIQLVSFCIGFLLSGSMLFYTVVSELSSANTRGVALSVLNTGVFLFNTFLLFIPYWFVTSASTQFFTYLWILPFFVMAAVLVVYFIGDSYSG